MPFDFKAYQAKCDGMSTEELHREWESYTRELSGGATGTATSVLLAPITGGMSLVGVGLGSAKVHNARKKREIIEAGLKARGTTHNTRKRDVLAPMAVTGAVNTLTMGIAGNGAGFAAGQVVGGVIENKLEKHHKNKADEKLQAQYENFKIQYAQEQQSMSQGNQYQYPLAGYQPGLQIPTSNPNGQASSPLSPAPATTLPGPPPYLPQFTQFTSQDQKIDVNFTSTSNNSKPDQPAFQQMTTSYEILAFHANTPHTSMEQAMQAAQQTNLYHGYPLPNEKPSASAGFPPEKPDITDYPSPCPTPLPLYSPPRPAVVQPAPLSLQHRPSLPNPPPHLPYTPIHRPSLPLVGRPQSNPAQRPSSPIYEIPTSTGRTTPTRNDSTVSMEEELALLRMKILQMELEKRGEHVEIEIEVVQENEGSDGKPQPEGPEIFPESAWGRAPPRKGEERKGEGEKKPEPVVGNAASSGPKLNPVVNPQQPVPMKASQNQGPPSPKLNPFMDSQPKLNPFVDIQQPVPMKPAQQNQASSAPGVIPYPATPQPDKNYQRPTVEDDPQEFATAGLSISAGISISYNKTNTQPHQAPSKKSENAPQNHSAATAQYQQPPRKQTQNAQQSEHHAQNQQPPQQETQTPPQLSINRPQYQHPPQHKAQSTPQQPTIHPQSHITTPPPQPQVYQTYNPHQRTQSVHTTPPQELPTPFQAQYTTPPPVELPVPSHDTYAFKPASSPQISQAYSAQQTPPPNPGINHQYTYPLPTPPHVLQHQDSGYGSNPSTRHSSHFSVSTMASFDLDHSRHVVSPPTPAFATLNVNPATQQQNPQQYERSRQFSYAQIPMTTTPAPMTPQQQQGYFPPPLPAPNQNQLPHRMSTPNPQMPGYQPTPPPTQNYMAPRMSTPNPQMQGYQPAPPTPNLQTYQPSSFAPPTPIYNNPPAQQNYQPQPQFARNHTMSPTTPAGSGWQWGNPQAGASGEPNYGPPPPIPGQWRGS